MKTCRVALICFFFLPAVLQAEESNGLTLETRVDRTTNLIVWMDNLAGSSVGKTSAVYRHYWLERFGPLDEQDRSTLEAFKRVRDLSIPRRGGVVNETGCLPLEKETLFWNQTFMAKAMQASSIQGFAESLEEEIDAADALKVRQTLERFDRRFDRAWKDLRHVRKFDKRLKRFLAKGGLTSYLEELAEFFNVTGREHPSMKISLIGLPADGATHAEADGDHLLVEIRPSDTPEYQIPVIAHEATHFLMRRMTTEQHDGLARETYGAGQSGALFWRFLWEAIPTALGQGLAEARLAPRRFSTTASWYHVDLIDRIAKLTYPALAQSVNTGESIDDGIIDRLTRLLDSAGLQQISPATAWLSTSFWLSGTGLEGSLRRLKLGLGLGNSVTSPFFLIDDPDAVEFLKKYECVGGVVLLRPAEIDRAMALGGVDNDLAETIGAHAAAGHAVIASSERSSGGIVFYLVTPDTRDVKPLIEAFLKLRGIPENPVILPPTPMKSP